LGPFTGTYARDRDISEEDSIADSALWKKLDGHNDFIANRIRSLSLSAWQQNHKVSTDYAIPNWSQEEWVEFKKENNFAGNVTVTMDDFYNKVHQDDEDLNPWTYGFFSFRDRATGKPRPPPSKERGFRLHFTRHAVLIDFAHANGIVEVLWQTTQFEHCTTPPPPSLQSTDKYTHFGCSFQINSKLGNSSLKLKGASEKQIKKKTLCKSQRYTL
jgi:hypothetical protein